MHEYDFHKHNGFIVIKQNNFYTEFSKNVVKHGYYRIAKNFQGTKLSQIKQFIKIKIIIMIQDG